MCVGSVVYILEGYAAFKSSLAGSTTHIHKVKKTKTRINSSNEFLLTLKSNDIKFYVGESATVKSILADIRDIDIGFHGGNETVKLVLCDRGFSCWKFHVVKALKVPNPKKFVRLKLMN